MEKIIKEFYDYLEKENKEKAVNFILSKLKNNEVDVLDLYMKILTPVQNETVCKVQDKRICIWKEHVRTSIVRTIVESCYPYVIKKRDEMNYGYTGTAVVICPPEEYHDLGARMVSDFFTICGYDSIYVGSNTPYHDFYNGIDIIRPDIVAISVSNYYNLVATKKIVEDIRNTVTYPLKILVGGHAFNDDETKYKEFGADFFARTFEDILKIVEVIK